jgi:hypothetical protein
MMGSLNSKRSFSGVLLGSSADRASMHEQQRKRSAAECVLQGGIPTKVPADIKKHRHAHEDGDREWLRRIPLTRTLTVVETKGK